ncbi:nicotinate phosphoribosyltransferase [Haliangium ochraceum]|uniref:Nicotinate phosphoribosyltransferase n=1 Tax=Haliangium ochraceum (strain DSM 14365 / JCM 11303 / SMP-2) TaxID=502025 RepID=D0LH78_HALO1|nr:nicotinate phosphoribosyltransferase [Haliangium ochraceum]ACY18223.1 nicotinate phosphoribosyltransferase [Haliangium ochraceum DSM 14365]
MYASNETQSPSTPALFTDLYQLTMASGYWRHGMAEREAAFHLFFRRNPFGSGFAIACGLQAVVEYLRDFRFSPDELRFLSGLRGNDERPLFDPAFLDYLSELRLSCDIDAVPEGVAIFAHEPMLRVVGPVLQCQLLETALLALLNFPTLVATKAARICQAARGEPVLEFGMRRAQGQSAAMTASRAAYIGGAAATSNVLAGMRFGIPVKGTHAHSWVMCFDDEPSAFRAYAEALPNNCVFVVDTYDTLQGVHNAITVGEELRARGHVLAGIRLDSGDLAQLSIAAREILDERGFSETLILASNDLDEYAIEALKERGATIAVWGVGTRLATAYDQPALEGVYKLGAVRDAEGAWVRRMKLSEEPGKNTNPGILQVRRFRRDGRFLGDVIYDVEDRDANPYLRDAGEGEASGAGDAGDLRIADAMHGERTHLLHEAGAGALQSEDLLVPVTRKGKVVYRVPNAYLARDRALGQLSQLDEGVRKLRDPAPYLVGLDPSLRERKLRMVAEARERVSAEQSEGEAAE